MIVLTNSVVITISITFGVQNVYLLPSAGARELEPPGCPPPARGWVWRVGRAPSPENF